MSAEKRDGIQGPPIARLNKQFDVLGRSDSLSYRYRMHDRLSSNETRPDKKMMIE